MSFRQKYFDKVMKKYNMIGKDREVLKKWFNKFRLISWSIMKFLSFLWITRRIYAWRGFEETVIYLLALMIFLLRLELRREKLKVE